jgi:hypothetical protein
MQFMKLFATLRERGGRDSMIQFVLHCCFEGKRGLKFSLDSLHYIFIQKPEEMEEIQPH